MDIQWFPGHMKKTQRAIEEAIKKVDAVCEILDARIPLSSRNPDIDALTAGKPRLIVLNHTDQADSAKTKLWSAYFRRCGYAVMETAAKSGAGVKEFVPAVRAGRAHDPRDGRRNPQCGQVHLYQPRGRQDPCQGGKPAGRNPLQSVGQCGRQLGAFGYTGDFVAQV